MYLHLMMLLMMMLLIGTTKFVNAYTFFISQLIFFNDPSKFVYSKGAFRCGAGFFYLGQGAIKIEKYNFLQFCHTNA